MQGICKYCGKETNLIKSHIIPKSFYQIKKWGQFSGINAQKNILDKVHSQNGWKELLLCAACDNHLGFLDNQAYCFLFEEVPQKEAIPEDFLFRYHFKKNEYNYNNLRRFFISLLWRISVSSKVPYTLGNYERIALEILKNRRPDRPELFIPLIYKKETNSNIDVISGILSKEVMGNREVNLRFPDYEIVFITDMSQSHDPRQAKLLKPLFLISVSFRQ